VSYGADIWCGDRLVPGRLSRGRSTVLLALYRRLITPRGTLRGGDEEGAYGFDVAGYVGAIGYESALAALPGLVRGELLKDDRVADIDVAATISTSTDGEVSIALVITGVLADEEEDFALTLGVSDTTVTILGGVE
jgi:hypothetical protein